MLRTARLFLVACVTTCLITIPWNDALAGQRGNIITEESQSQPPDRSTSGDAQAAPEGVTHSAPEASLIPGRLTVVIDPDSGHGKILRSALAQVPRQPSQVLRQTVASTNQHNFVLGVTAAAMVIGGVGLIAYSTTPSCKRSDQAACDRDKVLGAIGISGGSLVLVLWALSK